MIESIAVGVIILGAACYLFRSWRKSAAGKGCCGKDCGCRTKTR